MITEKPVIFDCEGDRLLGLVADVQSKTGLLIVVGGPQYRVGSHRQFVSLARSVINAGFSTFRFDYRGLGDSEGELLGFEHIEKDIDAALQIFVNSCNNLEHVVIWGLCDAASAIMMYVGNNASAHGLILLNPWLRTEKTQAHTIVRHYYWSRFLSRSFWRKLISGEFKFQDSYKEFKENFLKAFGCGRIIRSVISNATQTHTIILPYTQRMRHAMNDYAQPVLFILSGQDMTAAEFRDVTKQDKDWANILKKNNFEHKTIFHANHTFSDIDTKQQVEQWTIDWLRKL